MTPAGPQALAVARAFLLALLIVSTAAAGRPSDEDVGPFRFGITPVFLIDQGRFLDGWGQYLATRLGRPVEFVRRKSYAEITDMLLAGQLDAAWICSFSYAFNRASLTLLGIPVFHGEPYYQSYLIVPASDPDSQGYSDLAGKVFAYVEPRSNTGYLYPRYAVKQIGEDPDRFFRDSFFTWSHPDSVLAVADRLAEAAAVDGYIWESLRISDPELTDRTRVVNRSRQFGFPPIVGGVFLAEEDRRALTDALLDMAADTQGRRLLGLLHLDGFIPPREDIYDDITLMIQAVLPFSE